MRTQLNRALDRTIPWAHSVRIDRWEYHPYFLFSDLAKAATVATFYFYCRKFPELSFWKLVAELLILVVAYQGVLRLKARWIGTRSRSFLQDSLFFILPSYAMLSLAWGHPLPAALDVLGLVLPIYGSIVRVGCFFGGCCYGILSPIGVSYPARIFRSPGGIRRFQPGPRPQGRVLPVQLLEALGQAAVAALVGTWIFSHTDPTGAALPLFLGLYCVLRFGLDFLRQASSRPRIGRFSEAQVFPLAAGSIAWLIFAWLRLRGSHS